MDGKDNPFLLLSSLCEAYHWTVAEACKLTIPQILMLNHAAWVNHENSERKYNAKKPKNVDPLVSAEEQRLNEMSPDQLTRYMSESWE